MAGFDLRYLSRDFPNLLPDILDFFMPENAEKKGGKLLARDIRELSQHVATPNPDKPSSRSFPRWELLDKICSILVEYEVLIFIGGADSSHWKRKYLTNVNNERHKRVQPYLNFMVYGFPAVFESYQSSIIPIIRDDGANDRQVGTAFKYNERIIITAAHCITGATAINLRNISADHWKQSVVIQSKNENIDLAAILFQERVLGEAKAIPSIDGDVLEDVIVIGYPNVPGFTDLTAVEKATISSRITVSRGAIASKATELWSNTELFLITAQVRGGFSGGPVLDHLGRVVGVVSRQPTTEEGNPHRQYEGLGYGVTIPSAEITNLINGYHDGDETKFDRISHSDIEYLDWPN